MEFTVQVEKPSKIVRKLMIKVPSATVNKRMERGLVELQKTVKLKGFRPGNVPIQLIKQYYGHDVEHQVFHDLIDESFRLAVRDQELKTVGSPKIETPNHKKGEGAHDHGLKQGEDLTYTATVEVLPEIEVKGYTGLSLTRGKVEVTDEQLEQVVKNILDSRAELIPVSGGLVAADGSASSRPARKGDYVDINFTGAIETEKGREEPAGMKGNRVVEIGSESLIAGFEDHLVEMRSGETKTFKIPFPKDYDAKEFAGKEAEFTVTVNEVKEKKLPTLDDEFAKQVGYESVLDLRQKARDHLTREQTQDVDRKLRSDLLQVLIDKNSFEVPVSLIQAQTRALAQDVAGNLKNEGFSEEMIQELLTKDLDNLKKRAETQVRASLILEAIAKKEEIAVSADEGRREDLEFRMREDRTVKFLLEKAKVKGE